jgi:hypothetical protein
MPKERFHIFLAERLAREGDCRPPILVDIPAFLVGAVSPDIFYYDLPTFALSPLGDWFHSLIDRDGIGAIGDWVRQKAMEEENGRGRAAGEAISWGLGVACHFMADELWHPLIEELSGAGLGLVYPGAKNLTPIERHRLIESEIEAYWFGRFPEAQKKDYLPPDFYGSRGRLLRIFSHYPSLLRFAGGAAQGQSVRWAGLSERRITRCFLWQNHLLRLFANKALGVARDRLLSFSATRPLGALVAPAHPVLPELFARSMPDNRNPFSDSFMEEALGSLSSQWRLLLERAA